MKYTTGRLATKKTSPNNMRGRPATTKMSPNDALCVVWAIGEFFLSSLCILLLPTII